MMLTGDISSNSATTDGPFVSTGTTGTDEPFQECVPKNSCVQLMGFELGTCGFMANDSQPSSGGCDDCDPCTTDICTFCPLEPSGPFVCHCVFMEIPGCREENVSTTPPPSETGTSGDGVTTTVVVIATVGGGVAALACLCGIFVVALIPAADTIVLVPAVLVVRETLTYTTRQTVTFGGGRHASDSSDSGSESERETQIERGRSLYPASFRRRR